MTIDPHLSQERAARQRLTVQVAGELAVTEAELQLLMHLLDDITREKPTSLSKKHLRDNRSVMAKPKGKEERAG